MIRKDSENKILNKALKNDIIKVSGYKNELIKKQTIRGKIKKRQVEE